MKRSITLYINDRRVDLEDDTFVVFNYALEKLNNPTIQKNSWSNEINLPRTPENNKLFGDAFRVDRRVGEGGTGVGSDFNPSKKTPFAIYNEANEIVVSGYCKLNSVTPTAYKVGLYGGLGDFIYNLAYDSEGNKRTLASLDYWTGGENELDFDITKDAVKDAWARLEGDSSKSALWDIINFAPCYNGLPDNFQSDKALAVPSDVGLLSSSGEYTTSNGKTLITLDDRVDEWAAKDLRSYLQRPVLKMWKLLSAIADPNNNGGWNVDLTDIDTTTKFPYKEVWITRPLLPGLGTYNQQSGGITITPSSRGTTSNAWLMTYTLADVPANTLVSFRATFSLTATLTSSQSVDRMWTRWYANNGTGSAVTFTQAVGYDSSDNVCCVSKVNVGYIFPQIEYSEVASMCGYTPVTIGTEGAEYVGGGAGTFFNGSGTSYTGEMNLAVSLEGRNISYVKILVTRYTLIVDTWNHSKKSSASGLTLHTTGSYLNGTAVAESGCSLANVSATATISGESTLRSGSHITKGYLLNTEKTPADYLLAICKTFGLYILADSQTKNVQILRRNTLFQDQTIDLTGRVDTSTEITPLAFDAKWYDFSPESVGGKFEKEYQQVEGVKYGIQRVDTGYDFDANTKNLQDNLFKGCAAVCDHNQFWNYIIQSNVFKPSPFLWSGNKQTLWHDGESKDIDISQPSASATITYYDQTSPGYDPMSRPEFRDNKNNPVDGSDVLLFFNFSVNYKHFNITDDTSDMDAIADGPCWIFAPNNDGVDIPQFTRYSWRGQNIERMLSFGYPRQVDIPRANFGGAYSLYESCWQSYMRDRLSVHGKVLKCKVDLSGLKVGQDLLRKFWWYQGSLWVLNSINNYSLTTFDLADCEFIQIQNKTNYTNGQV